MKPDKTDATAKERARVEAAKRVSTAKFAAETGGDYELASLLIDAIHDIFPLPPEKPAKPSKAKKGKPSRRARRSRGRTPV